MKIDWRFLVKEALKEGILLSLPEASDYVQEEMKKRLPDLFEAGIQISGVVTKENEAKYENKIFLLETTHIPIEDSYNVRNAIEYLREYIKETAYSGVNGMFGEKIIAFIKEVKEVEESLLPELDANRIILSSVLGTLVGIQYPGLRVNTVTDVLRAAYVMSGQDGSLVIPEKEVRGVENEAYKQYKLKNFTRKERRYLLSLIENAKSPSVEDMKRRREMWLRFGEKVHPGEYRKQFPRTFQLFNILRNKKPIISWYSRLETLSIFKTPAKNVKDFSSFEAKLTPMLIHLSTRPGEFGRRIISIAIYIINTGLSKTSKTDLFNKVIEIFLSSEKAMSTRILFGLIGTIERYRSNLANKTIQRKQSIRGKKVRIKPLVIRYPDLLEFFGEMLQDLAIPVLLQKRYAEQNESIRETLATKILQGEKVPEFHYNLLDVISPKDSEDKKKEDIKNLLPKIIYPFYKEGTQRVYIDPMFQSLDAPIGGKSSNMDVSIKDWIPKRLPYYKYYYAYLIWEVGVDLDLTTVGKAKDTSKGDSVVNYTRLADPSGSIRLFGDCVPSRKSGKYKHSEITLITTDKVKKLYSKIKISVAFYSATSVKSINTTRLQIFGSNELVKIAKLSCGGYRFEEQAFDSLVLLDEVIYKSVEYTSGGFEIILGDVDYIRSDYATKKDVSTLTEEDAQEEEEEGLPPLTLFDLLKARAEFEGVSVVLTPDVADTYIDGNTIREYELSSLIV